MSPRGGRPVTRQIRAQNRENQAQTHTKTPQFHECTPRLTQEAQRSTSTKNEHIWARWEHGRAKEAAAPLLAPFGPSFL
jgi:hypothetical protein